MFYDNNSEYSRRALSTIPLGEAKKVADPAITVGETTENRSAFLAEGKTQCTANPTSLTRILLSIGRMFREN